MVQLIDHGVYYAGGKLEDVSPIPQSEARKRTIAYGILEEHSISGDPDNLRIKFDAMASHDITYVNIIQTARASGLTRFPMPYVLTNCHNSLCAVGGTINEDDHVFGLSAAKKYGGIFVPAHQSVIHSYMRENFAGCGRMILGSDSHTRYGALGTMAIGEGGPELVKQLLGRTYDVAMPKIIAVYLTGKPRNGVGPHDVILDIIGATFKNGFVKNAVLEFIGPGVASMPIDYRNCIDTMTTESTCLSSIWETDGETKKYLEIHGRGGDYRPLHPGDHAYYDAAVCVDLDSVEPMIALPQHPSNAITIRELNADPYKAIKDLTVDLSSKITPDGHVKADQAVIAGCAGGAFSNICAAADIIRGRSLGCGELALSVYPASQPVFAALLKNGVMSDLVSAGAVIRTAFCGPCFGAGDVPMNGGFSIRHTTRNFPNREGSKPKEGQSANVALMDARSIAATAVNGGIIVGADSIDAEFWEYDYEYDDSAYRSRVYNGWNAPDASAELKYGPNIKDWPEFRPLSDDLLIYVASVIDDPVTTTDELIPSGETSSFRSNPLRLAEFALSRKDPGYVSRSKKAVSEPVPDYVKKAAGYSSEPEIGTAVCAVKPGDGSAREQAASCQRVLGGIANIAGEYATKRYRSNLINWGMIPFTGGIDGLKVGQWLYVKGIRAALESGAGEISALIINEDGSTAGKTLVMPKLIDEEREIILKGCLINYYKPENN